METIRFFATAPRGMADLLMTELRGLDVSDPKENRAGVQFTGTIETAYRVCLWSRIANRVLMPLATFDAETPEELYEGARGVDWSRHMTVNQTVAVDTNLSGTTISHSHYAALKIKDALVDWFAAREGTRPNVDVDQPDIRINCYIHRDQAQLYLDFSGQSLHQRNYRSGGGQAPLKENLAAALLMRSGWPGCAGEGGAFFDPLCGSGTLPIEAALMAADIAPGLARENFGFLQWRQHRQDIWERLRAEAGYRRDKGISGLPPIIGFDHDRRVLDQARAGAERLGLGNHITFAYQDLFDFRHDFPPRGLVVTNPPYGKRLGEPEDLPALYGALGQVVRHSLRGWKMAVFTEDAELGKHLGMRARKRHTLFNGAIECKLLHFDIDESTFYRDNRLPARIDKTSISEQAQMFRNRLEKNLKQLKRWAEREDIHCYRVYDADLPDYSAAIDLYQHADRDETFVCVQEYEAPPSIDQAKARQRTRELVTVTQLVTGVPDSHLFFKTRSRQRGESQYQRQASEQQFHEVREGHCRLWVNFEDYLDTGLFLDHRPIRHRIGQEAEGKDFLNLFAYTGAATLHAVAGGARSTTTVDMSKTYLDWAKRNLAANGFAASDAAGVGHEFIQADCLAWLARAKDRSYDLIFLDPPAFSNSKRMADNFDVQQDHGDLIRATMALLRAGGTLYFSTNLRGFALDVSITEEFSVRDITPQTIPQDFKRRQNIHVCWTVRGRSR